MGGHLQDLLACHRLGRLYARQAEGRCSAWAWESNGPPARRILRCWKWPGRVRPGAGLAARLGALAPIPCIGDWFDLGGDTFSWIP